MYLRFSVTSALSSLFLPPRFMHDPRDCCFLAFSKVPVDRAYILARYIRIFGAVLMMI